MVAAHHNYSSYLDLFLTLRSMAANCKLRLVQFCETGGDKRRVGVERENGGSVVDITAVDPSIPADMKTFLQGWDSNALAAERLVAA